MERCNTPPLVLDDDDDDHHLLATTMATTTITTTTTIALALGRGRRSAMKASSSSTSSSSSSSLRRPPPFLCSSHHHHHHHHHRHRTTRRHNTKVPTTTFTTTTTKKKKKKKKGERNTTARAIDKEEEEKMKDLVASLEPPKVDLDLDAMQEELGATRDQDGFVVRYTDDDANGREEETKILRNECAILDRSAWGVFRIANKGTEEEEGGDVVTFLEKLSNGGKLTAEEIGSMQPGTGKRVNGCLDVYAQESGAFLVIASREDVKEKKVETLAEECKISEVMNLASRCVLLTVCGPKTLEVLKTTGLAAVLEAGKEYENAHAVFGFENRPVVCCKTNEFVGKCGDGSAVNFLVDEGVAGQVWAAIIKAGALPVGSEALDALMCT
jgi:hypothetical protein